MVTDDFMVMKYTEKYTIKGHANGVDWLKNITKPQNQ